jgi:hypothetical protein
MARPRTITPVEPLHVEALTFSHARIVEFGQVDSSSKWIKFACQVGKGYEELFAAMKWQTPSKTTMVQGLEGVLKTGSITLTPALDEDAKIKAKSKNGKLNTTAEFAVEYDKISSFQCVRRELEGRKGKGFRRILNFTVTHHAECGCAELEVYQLATDNARGSLRVTYTVEAEQEPIPTTDGQQSLIPDAVMASEEQRQAVSQS